MRDTLIQFVIFEDPSDYPDKWVARKFTITPGKISAGPAYICDSLEAARAHVWPGLVNIGRTPQDHRTIKEVWT
jgi:hypothetical protein